MSAIPALPIACRHCGAYVAHQWPGKPEVAAVCEGCRPLSAVHAKLDWLNTRMEDMVRQVGEIAGRLADLKGAVR